MIGEVFYIYLSCMLPFDGHPAKILTFFYGHKTKYLIMGYFRFWKRINILSGLSLNLGKKGISFSIGTKGLRFTNGNTESRITTGIPNTGISYSHKLKDNSTPIDTDAMTDLQKLKELMNGKKK